ncbi:MAG: SpoIIE family protein phosphatase [Bacteroidota bacterium]
MTGLARISFTFLFILLVFVSGAQDQQVIDSLKARLKNQPEDTLRAMMLNKLAWEVSYINLFEGEKLAKEAVALADKLNHGTGRAETRNTLGTIYWDMGAHDEAIKEFVDAVKICEEIGYESMIGVIYSNIGGVFNSQLDHTAAKKYYRLSIDYLLKNNKLHNLKLAYMNMGSTFYDSKILDSAEFYFDKALGLADSTNYDLSDASIFLNYSALYFEKKDINRALYYNDRAAAIIEPQNADYYRVSLYIDRGVFLWKKNRSPESLVLLNKALKLAEEIGFRQKVKSAYQQLSEVHEDMGNFREALKYHKLFFAINDSIFSQEKNKQLKLLEARYQNEKNEKKIEVQKKENELLSQKNQLLALETEKQQHDNEKNKIILWFVSGMVVLFMILSFMMFKRYRDKKKTNIELSLQKAIIQEKNNEITSSIRYAQRIQKTVLSSDENLRNFFPEHFVIFRPKDIVSGDFYWSTEKVEGSKLNVKSREDSISLSTLNFEPSTFYLAVCDSTGHGVPGAFMSLLNTSFLNEAINQKKIRQPNEVFNYVRKKLIENVSSEGGKDGMDGVLLKVEDGKVESYSEPSSFNVQLSYAAANNSPVIIRNNTIIDLPCDKMPVGKGHYENDFSLFSAELKKDDMLYLFTDGYADQFGSESDSGKPTGKKFKKNNLKKLLAEISLLPVNEQKNKLEATFDNWKGDFEQIDDVCIIGLRIS